MLAEGYGLASNCSDLWGSTGHQASHRGAAKHGICFASRLVPSNVNSYVGKTVVGVGAIVGVTWVGSAVGVGEGVGVVDAGTSGSTSVGVEVGGSVAGVAVLSTTAGEAVATARLERLGRQHRLERLALPQRRPKLPGPAQPPPPLRFCGADSQSVHDVTSNSTSATFRSPS